jgi:hypothetical protein
VVSKTSLHHLTRKPLTWRSGLTATASAFQSENDRTAGIIAATTIDVGLERLIKTRFRSLKAADAATIFSGTGPLSTFSGKIQIAYALGVIGPHTRHDFHTIKDIRNVFAHSAKTYSFKTPQIRNRCLGMHIVLRTMRLGDGEIPDARHEFLAATRIFWFLLQLRGGGRVRVKLDRQHDDLGF